MDAIRSCPYCGEDIKSAATRCRYCRSRLRPFDPERWRRDSPQRHLAGVATGAASALGVPVGAVRLGFIVLAFFHLLGPLLYGALWLVVPYVPGEESVLARGLGRAQRAVNQLFHVQPCPASGTVVHDPPPAAGGGVSGAVPQSPIA